MHLRSVTLFPGRFPVRDRYPFNLALFQNTPAIQFRAAVTFFVGENGSGKSTLLRAIAKRCGIHHWSDGGFVRHDNNPYAERLCDCIEAGWTEQPVPGSLFTSDTFRHFAELLDVWASTDPGLLAYFGGKSLVNLSHGQSILAFFNSRFKVRGLYLLDEPETALSPLHLIEFMRMVSDMAAAGHAQFIIASHSPILLACSGAELLAFDSDRVRPVAYEETDYFRVYREFLMDRKKYGG